MTGRPYADTIEDALFLWESDLRDPELIAERLGMARDSLNAVFRRCGLTPPWRAA